MRRRRLRTGIAITVVSVCAIASGVIAASTTSGAGPCLAPVGHPASVSSLMCSSTAQRIAWHPTVDPGAPPPPGAQLWTWTVPLPSSGRGLVYTATTYISDSTLVPVRETASIDLEHCLSMDLFIAQTPDETPESGLLAGWYGGARYAHGPPSVSGSVTGVSGRLRVVVSCYGRNFIAGAVGATPAGTVTVTFEQVPLAADYL
jgi:hypothetical protein